MGKIVNFLRKTLLLTIFVFIVPVNSADNSKVLICVSSSSKKYHNGYCRGMNNCTHADRWVTVSEAKTMGRSPCGYCY